MLYRVNYHCTERKPLLLILQLISFEQFWAKRRAEVNYGIDNNIRARGAHPRETVAGRAGRVLVDRTADTLTAPMRGFTARLTSTR